MRWTLAKLQYSLTLGSIQIDENNLEYQLVACTLSVLETVFKSRKVVSIVGAVVTRDEWTEQDECAAIKLLVIRAHCKARYITISHDSSRIVQPILVQVSRDRQKNGTALAVRQQLWTVIRGILK